MSASKSCSRTSVSSWERSLVRLADEVSTQLAGHGHAGVGADDGLAWVDLG